MPIAKLSIDLEARLAGLQQGLDKASHLAERSAARIDQAFGAVKTSLAGLGAGLSVGAFATWLRVTSEGVDQLNDLADATGASVENLSALEDIAVRTGTSVDTMGDAVIKLNKALADAKPGSDQAAAFSALGVSVQELKALDPAEAFQRVAIALRGFADDGNKARLVQELFGRSLREVAPLLRDVAEAGKLVATVTSREAAEAEAFNKELFALQKSATDASRALVGPMIEAINQTIDKFREGRAAGKGFWETLLEGPRKLAGVAAGQLPLSELAPKLDSQAGAGRGFVHPDFVRPSLPDIATQAKASAGGAPRRAAASDRPGLAEIFDPTERFRASERAAQALVDEALRTSDLADAQRQRADALKLVAAEQERLNDLLGDTPTAQLEQTRKDMQLLAQAFEDGRISAEQFTEAAQARLGTIAAAAERATDEWSIFADQAARNIQDALGDTLQATMEGNWRSIGDAWKRTLDRMVAEALAAKLGQALLGDFGKTGNVGGLAGDAIGFFSTLLKGSANGNAFGPGGVLAFAGGGVVDRATPFAFAGGRLGVMGEAGPEAVVPLKRGRDGKLGVGGGIVVNQTIHVTTSGPADRRSMAQLQTEIGLATQRAIARNT